MVIKQRFAIFHHFKAGGIWKNITTKYELIVMQSENKRFIQNEVSS